MLGSFQLSQLQKEYWNHRDQLRAEASFTIAINGVVNSEKLVHAIEQVLNAHAIFSTSLILKEAMSLPLQVTETAEILSLIHI